MPVCNTQSLFIRLLAWERLQNRFLVTLVLVTLAYLRSVVEHFVGALGTELLTHAAVLAEGTGVSSLTARWYASQYLFTPSSSVRARVSM